MLNYKEGELCRVQVAWGSSGVAIHRGTQEVYKYDAQGHSLVADFVALGSWLDLMILKIASNLGDSVILMTFIFFFFPPHFMHSQKASDKHSLQAIFHNTERSVIQISKNGMESRLFFILEGL